MRNNEDSTPSAWGARFGRRAFLAIVLATVLPPGAHAAPKQYPYEVVSTVGMVNDIVRNVAGEFGKPRALLGAGVDPHLYKPTRDDVSAMMRADIIFYSGLMLEGKMADTLAKVSRLKPVFAVTSLIDKQSLLEPPEFGGHFDPHVWMDPSAWGLCADAVAQSLSEFDPKNADSYKKNAAAYRQQCMVLHAYGKQALATVPKESRILISSHDAFNYFGRAFDLQVMGVQGISTESEAGLQRINELVDLIVSKGVKAVFVESSVSPKNIQALVAGVNSRGKELKIGGELFSDAMGAEGAYEGTYFGMIDHNITLVTRALGGDVPAKGQGGKLSHVP